MREALHSVKWSLILASLLYLVLGVALLFWPDTSNLILCYLIAAVLTAYGAFQVIAFFGREGGSWIGLIIGIICAGFGVYALIQPTGISDIISIILGFVIVVDGALSLRRDWRLRALSFPKWWVPFLLDLTVLVLGLIVVFNPLLFARLLLQVIGVVLLYESISDLWAIHRISKLTWAADQAVESDPPVIEVEVEEADDP